MAPDGIWRGVAGFGGRVEVGRLPGRPALRTDPAMRDSGLQPPIEPFAAMLAKRPVQLVLSGNCETGRLASQP